VRTKSSATISFLLLLSVLIGNGLASADAEEQTLGFEVRMSVTFSNTGSEVWTLTEEEKTISLFMNNTWQMVQLENSSYPIERLETDKDGNHLATLRFPESELRVGGNATYTLTYNVVSKSRSLPSISEEKSGRLADITEDMKEEYCKAEENWLISDTELYELAQNLKKNETNILTIVKECVAWISSNIQYQTHDLPWYANETFKEKRGDCDDQAILLITLCRICQIPAYLQVGCMYLQDVDHVETYWEDHVTVVSKGIGWHGWALVYVPPWGWLPVDLTYVTAPGGLRADPLNAIRGAAVTMQTVIQYMNVSKTDYVESSMRYKEFLLEHGFRIHEIDEMIPITPADLPDDTLWRLLPLVVVAVVTPAVVAAIVSFVYAATRKKESHVIQPETS
jgi:hypothetical protein